MTLCQAHWAFGHVNYDSILAWAWEKAGTLREDGVVLTDQKRVWCARCKGANLKLPSTPAVSAHRPTDIMQWIAFDVFGRTRIAGVGNTRYFNVGRERACGFAWSALMTYKSQAAAHVIHVIRFEQKQFGAHVKVLFLFEDNGTFHRVLAPYKSDDNGGVERLIGIIEAMTRLHGIFPTPGLTRFCCTTCCAVLRYRRACLRIFCSAAGASTCGGFDLSACGPTC